MKKGNTEKINKKEDIAIKVENLSKTFKVPHEKDASIKGAVLNMFRKKNYEKFEALNDISFEVKKGEFFGIIGRNGSGKSTLLKMLAGIYVPDSGEITINGKISPFLELGVGFNPELTGRENLFLGGAILGLTRKEVEEKYEKIVSFAELEEFIDMKLKNYSSGMQVRLAFSLAISVNAEILLMDEVLAVGDSNFQSKCLDVFNKYKRQGKTIILVTHDIGVTQRFCDRAILVEDGRITAVGKAREVCNKYLLKNVEEMGKHSLNKLNNRHLNTLGLKSVSVLDVGLKPKNVFNESEDVVVRVVLNNKENTDNLNLGVAIYNNDDTYVFGTNTFIKKLNFDLSSRNQVDFILKKHKLNSNKYILKVGLWGDNPNKLIDLWEPAAEFDVISRSQNDGVADFNFEWR